MRAKECNLSFEICVTVIAFTIVFPPLPLNQRGSKRNAPAVFFTPHHTTHTHSTHPSLPSPLYFFCLQHIDSLICPFILQSSDTNTNKQTLSPSRALTVLICPQEMMSVTMTTTMSTPLPSIPHLRTTIRHHYQHDQRAQHPWPRHSTPKRTETKTTTTESSSTKVTACLLLLSIVQN